MSWPSLTDADREILTLFADNYPPHEIAQDLKLVVTDVRHTVEDLCGFDVGLARQILAEALGAPVELTPVDLTVPIEIQPDASAELAEAEPFRVQAQAGITTDDLREHDHQRLLDDAVLQTLVSTGDDPWAGIEPTTPTSPTDAAPDDPPAVNLDPRYEVIATDDVMERVDQWWCHACGGRYAKPFPIHGSDCNRRQLTPVTVLIVLRRQVTA